MSNVLDNMALWEALGQFATGLGKEGSTGYKLGVMGQQSAEQVAARQAQEKAEKEAKKKKQSGILGDIGSVAGGALGTIIAPGVGTAIGAGLGNIGGQAAGGGKLDYASVAPAVLSGAAPLLDKALTPTPVSDVPPLATPTATAPTEPLPSSVQAAMPAQAPHQAKALAPVAPVVADTPPTSWQANVKSFLDSQYGGYDPSGNGSGISGAATWLAGSPARHETSISETLAPVPGLSAEGFQRLKAGARADDQVKMQGALAQQNAAYRAQNAAIAQRRLGLEEANSNKPIPVKSTDASGREITTFVNPNTLQPVQGVAPLAGGYSTGMAPRYGVTQTEKGLVPWQAGPSGTQFGEAAPNTERYHVPQPLETIRGTGPNGTWTQQRRRGSNQPEGPPVLDRDVAQSRTVPKPQPGFSLSPGQVRYDASGNVVAEGPTKAPAQEKGTAIEGGAWRQLAEPIAQYTENLTKQMTPQASNALQTIKTRLVDAYKHAGFYPSVLIDPNIMPDPSGNPAHMVKFYNDAGVEIAPEGAPPVYMPLTPDELAVQQKGGMR